MGTRFTITLEADDAQAARTAFQAAFARIEQLDGRLSDYQADSELNQLCRQSPTPEPIEVSRDLFQVLSAAQQISQQSKGAFDVTVGPLTKLWRVARKQKKLPSDDGLAQAMQAVGYQHIELSEQDGKYYVNLTRENMQLDLGGIAKGFALDEALATLKAQNIDSALIDGGGDLALSDPPAGSQGWRIGIAPLRPDAPPSESLTIANHGIATSGDAWQYVEIDGRRFSHIVDPKTGLGLEQRSSVTVIARTGMQADALASAVSVLGPKRGIELIDAIEEVEAMIVVASEQGAKTYLSQGIQDLLQAEAGEASD
jgi:thiamine biosynthesis lipoprotein